MKMKITLLVVGLVAAFALALSPPPPVAEGQTPDGETPAEEDVCTAAGLTGAAWGLCNAYCEAMDCDGDPQASPEACAKVKANFDKKTGGKIALPCELVECTGKPPGLVLSGVDWAGTGALEKASIACATEAAARGCGESEDEALKACISILDSEHGGSEFCTACIRDGYEPCSTCGGDMEKFFYDTLSCKFIVQECTP
jgi:hypothetical protein